MKMSDDDENDEIEPTQRVFFNTIEVVIVAFFLLFVMLSLNVALK